jgi:hypothetical protein
LQLLAEVANQSHSQCLAVAARLHEKLVAWMDERTASLEIALEKLDASIEGCAG